MKRLSRFDLETKQLIWSTFTVPDRPSFLLAIDAEVQQSGNATALAAKYPWILHGYDGINGDAQPYFEGRITALEGENIDVSVDTDARAAARFQLAETLHLSVEEVLTLAKARQLVEWMDERKQWMLQTRHLLTGRRSTHEHGWVFANNEAHSLPAAEAETLWERYVSFKDSETAITGIVASYGAQHFVYGEVVVVQHPHDTVEDGKILVTPYTDPSYVPLMRKAKALITDHGGIMSHAAIVAREFKLPCIVSTKRATKVLKTGDRVVLDLLTGNVMQNEALE